MDFVHDVVDVACRHHVQKRTGVDGSVSLQVSHFWNYNYHCCYRISISLEHIEVSPPNFGWGHPAPRRPPLRNICLVLNLNFQVAPKTGGGIPQLAVTLGGRNLYHGFPKYELRGNFFSNGIVNMWNSLPDSIVLADNINQFKSRLDPHWKNYAFMYDHRLHNW